MTNTTVCKFAVCILVRLLASNLPLYTPKSYLKIIGMIFCIQSTTLLYLYFTSSRLQAPEGGGVTWWAKYRILHGILYALAASSCFVNLPEAAHFFLTCDVVLGIILYVLHRHFQLLPNL